MGRENTNGRAPAAADAHLFEPEQVFAAIFAELPGQRPVVEYALRNTAAALHRNRRAVPRNWHIPGLGWAEVFPRGGRWCVRWRPQDDYVKVPHRTASDVAALAAAMAATTATGPVS